jgi:poly-gamma-glutamate capsule biosynthesis protein CapA/YwtB (metallophosphatase superfamily)
MFKKITLLFSTLFFLSDTTSIQKTQNTEGGTQTLSMMFAGDIMSQMPQIESAYNGNGTYNYTPCFQYIRPVFESSDLVFGNLEFTMPGHPPYTGYPNFRSPDQMAEALKKAGFDILVTSNNHSVDGGLEGINHTIDALRQNKFITTGTFKNTRYKDLLYPLIVYKNGFKIALLNYTHHTNGYKTPTPSVVNRLVMNDIKKDIAEAKKMKPDFIITFLHWGVEHIMNEDENQKACARIIHDWGSDLVLGSHPHVVQPIKNERVMHNGKEKYNLTAYSLGNFISAQPFPNTEGGIVFEVSIKKENGVTSIDDYHYIPVLRYTPHQDGKTRYFALPISAFEGNEKAINMPLSEQTKMHNFVGKIRPHLEKYGAKELKFDLKDVLD